METSDRELAVYQRPALSSEETGKQSLESLLPLRILETLPDGIIAAAERLFGYSALTGNQGATILDPPASRNGGGIAWLFGCPRIASR